MISTRIVRRSLRRYATLGAAALVANTAASTAVAQPPLSAAARWADSARRVIEAAHIAGDTVALQRASQLVDRALVAFPSDPLLLHYRGYVAYRQAQTLTTRAEEDRLSDLLKDALKRLDAAATAGAIAETHALRASMMGQLMGLSMVNGMRYAQAYGEAEDNARAMGPANPRVLLLSAISTYYKPAMFGGGEEKGRALLDRALAAFASDAPKPPAPAWGRAEAYAWLGQMEQKNGRSAAARAAYTRALELEPNYAWVKYVLLPGVR